MDNNINITTRELTFEDVAVKELARGRALCVCNIQFGRCTKSECAKCEHHIRFNNCVSQMSDYDKERLSTNISDYYREYSLYPQKFMRYKALKRSTFKYVLIAIVVLLICCCFAENMEATKIGTPVEGDKVFIYSKNGRSFIPDCKDIMYDISLCSMYTVNTARDRNGDGDVNCIDYSTTFKYAWDTKFGHHNYPCLIVWNYNPEGDFNHVFNAIVYGKYVLMIEPQSGYEDYRLFVADYWGSKYRYSCDEFNSTEQWMKECGF